MGDYTEFFFRAEVVDLPDAAIELLRAAQECGWHDLTQAGDRIEHPLFDGTRRWEMLFIGASAYFQQATSGTRFTRTEHPARGHEDNDWDLVIHSSLKDYDNEIDQFIDWIRPHVVNSYSGGGFLGYSLFEYAKTPKPYFIEGHDA